MSSAASMAKRTEDQAGSRFYVWSFPGSPIRVRLSLDLIPKIREYLNRGAGSDLLGPSESGGLLLGRAVLDRVDVIEFEAFTREKPSSAHFALSPGEKLDLMSDIERLNRTGGGISVVGYFRSQIRDGLRLYEQDLSLIQDLFGDPLSVFLIVRPADPPGASNAGFFFRDGPSIFTESSFMPFPFDEQLLVSEEKPVLSPPVPPPEPRTSAPVWPKAPRVAPPKRHKRRSRSRVLPVFLLMAFAVGTTAGVLLFRSGKVTWPLAPPAERDAARNASDPIQVSPMALSIVRSGRDIAVTWDPAAPAVTRARVGVLTIRDGNGQREVPLTQALLQSSKLVYTPKSDTVQVALEVFSPDGTGTREAVMLLLNGPNPITIVRQTPAPAQPVRPAATGSSEDSGAPAREFIAPPVGRKTVDRSIRVEQPPAIETSALAREVSALGTPLSAPGVSVPPPPVPAPQGALRAVKPEGMQAVTVEPPKPLRQVRPVIPANVRSMLTERVTVQVRVEVDASGKVTGAVPLASGGRLGYFLSTAAVNAARLWLFEPAKRGNQTIAGEFMLHFTFVPNHE
jgi:hypothetical protein